MYAQADQAENSQHDERDSRDDEEPRCSPALSLPSCRDAERQGGDQANRRQDDSQGERHTENETIASADSRL